MSLEKVQATRAWRYIWWGVSVIAVTVVLAAAWIGVRGLMAKSEFDSLARLSAELRSVLTLQDRDTAMPLITEVGEHAARATSLTSDPIWALAEHVPVLGANMATARVAAAQVDAVMRDAVPPVLAAATLLQGAIGEDDRLDVSTFRSLTPELRRAVAVLDSATDSLGAIDQDQVLPQLASGIDELQGAIRTAQPAVDALARGSQVLPTVLGTESPTRILVMAQNNAELRTGGGITGTFIELEVSDSRVRILSQADSSAFQKRVEPEVSLPASTTALYGPAFGGWVQNASMTPDFAVTAAIVQARWQELTGSTPTIIVSVDPVVLGALLEAVGPVHLDGAELNAENFVERVLIEPYATLDQSAQTALFEAAVTAVVDRLSHGTFEPMTLVDALTGPVERGHISVWSADHAIQTAIDGTALAGPAARHHQAGDTAFAVYLNDATGGKMDVFLEAKMSAATTVCQEDGRRDITVVVELSSDAPVDAASLPFSVTGGGFGGVDAGDISTQITVAAPPHAFFGGVIRDGAIVPSGDVIDAGFPSSTVTLTLKPGESRTAAFRFILNDGATTDPTILHTPMLNAPELTIKPSRCQ